MVSLKPQSLKSYRRWLLPFALVAIAVLIPTVGMAIPGSGEFIAEQSTGGRDITHLYNVIAKICLGILILVEGILIIAIVKFRRQSEDEEPEKVYGDLKLEVGWTLAALLIQVYIGWVTIDVMYKVEQPEDPDPDVTIEAIAYQWDWQFRYDTDDGSFVHKDLVIPAHKTVKLEVTSKDVLHSIFIPDLGVKIDAVPGRFNYWWFRADGPKAGLNEGTSNNKVENDQKKHRTTRSGWWAEWAKIWGDLEDDQRNDGYKEVTYLGTSEVETPSPYRKYDAVEYRGMCTELCGKGHYDMYFRTVVMTQQSYDEWKTKVAGGGGVETDGAKLYADNCSTCHGSDGTGTTEQYPPLAGTRWTNDDDMKKEHVRVILTGLNGKIEVKGKTYDGVMQPWHQQFNDVQVAAIANHERKSWGNEGAEIKPELVAEVRDEEGLPPSPGGGSETVSTKDLIETGKKVYSSCQGCHGADGKGRRGMPGLDGNPKVIADPKGFVDLLINGQDTDKWNGYQPPMGKSMSARELAGVITYVRQAWSNDASAVQPQEVKDLRRTLNEQ